MKSFEEHHPTISWQHNVTGKPTRWQDTTPNISEQWQHWLWTDRAIHTFIHLKFSKYKRLFRKYFYAIQKADAMRYFVVSQSMQYSLNFNTDPKHEESSASGYRGAGAGGGGVNQVDRG